MSEKLTYSMWLIFDDAGGVRISRGAEPHCDGYERAMSLRVVLPHSLFTSPRLEAYIQVPDSGPPQKMEIVVKDPADE